ncbi:MAG: peptidylprolyl isomerase [Firmicutes bacterium]|nr:peptidylprolyl isomerase [Bacillota bacterium]
MKKATIEMENGGLIEIEFFQEQAPKTVENFVSLAEKGFYDGLAFHRVIPGFVAQGGCPLGTGTGGPGYTIKCETKDNPNKHVRGAISMAHAGPDTGGSQFFICYDSFPHLDGLHTVFAQVTSGMDVVDAIKQGDKMKEVKIL